MKLIIKVGAILLLVFLAYIVIISYTSHKIDKAENICKNTICNLDNSQKYTDYVYAKKFNSCFCLNGVYTEKVEELFWWKV